MMGQHSTHFITFNQGVLSDIEPVAAAIVVPAPPVVVPASYSAPDPPVEVPSWVFCEVQSDVVSAYLMQDVAEVRVLFA